MKFKVSEDIDAPQDLVFAQFADFSTFEAEARNRKAVLTRVGDWTEAAVGNGWTGEVTIRDKTRPLAAEITVFEPSERYVIESKIGGMDCYYELTFIALSPRITRVAMVLNLAAKTITARLLLQTLKLARGRVLQRLEGMLARRGNAVEALYKRQTG